MKGLLRDETAKSPGMTEGDILEPLLDKHWHHLGYEWDGANQRTNRIGRCVRSPHSVEKLETIVGCCCGSFTVKLA